MNSSRNGPCSRKGTRGWTGSTSSCQPFFRTSPGRTLGHASGRGPGAGPPQFSISGQKRSRLHASGRAGDRYSQAGYTQRPSAMGRTGLALKPGHLTISRSETRDQDRTTAGHGLAAQRDPPGCRRRATGAVEKTARPSHKPNPAVCGKTSHTTPACNRVGRPKGPPDFCGRSCAAHTGAR